MNSVDHFETKKNIAVMIHNFLGELLRLGSPSLPPQELQDLHTLSNETTHLESKIKFDTSFADQQVSE